MKTIFANGCSWTWGGAIECSDDDRFNKITWPAQLRDIMGYDNVVNKAMGCGSNQRIVRTTFDWVLSQPKEILENTLAVIQWTDPSRYEYYVPDTDVSATGHTIKWENIEENWALAKVGVILSSKEYFYSYDELLKRVNDRLSTNTIIENIYKNITYFETLKGLFQKYNVKYYFWDMSVHYEALPEPYKSYILNNFNWLEPKGRHLWEYDRISRNDSHPSINGHKQLANHIKTQIENCNYYGKY